MGFASSHRLIQRQISRLFGLSRSERRLMSAASMYAREQSITCISGALGKYENRFRFLNSNHALVYICWLSFFANRLSDGLHSLPTKLYLLNKTLHSVDIYFEVQMPASFFCEHPVGAVMGRASYGDNFFFYQQCTVGGSHRGSRLAYPTIGQNVRMFVGASILGDAHVKDNVTLGAGALEE